MDLSGVTVLDLTRLLPGPYATQLLADAGADVLKVERPGTGDPARTMALGDGPDVFSTVNRGKRSVTFDLKQPAAREALLSVAAEVDVVVEGFRPGVAARLGVDYEAVRDANEDVVYCSLSGFGATGPNRDRAGHDLNYVALAGLLDLTRADEDGRPAIPGFPIADMAGGMLAAFAIVSALLSRELGSGDADGSDGGEHLDVSLTDAVLSFSQAVSPEAFAGGEPTGRRTPLTGEYPCYDVYETADGGYVTLAALEPPFWQAFCETIGRDDLIENHYARDPATRERTREAIATAFRERSREEWEAALGDSDVMFAPVYTLAEAMESDHVRARDLVSDSPDAPPRIGFPLRTTEAPPDVDESIPSLGEHTASVLREYGFESGEIEDLREQDAI